MLFSELNRTFDGPKGHAEPSFEYLDRSARVEAHAVRSELTKWVERYPEHQRGDLIARFRSPDEVQHRGAAFELYLHEVLLRLGYEVTVHPETPTELNTRPDFLARRNDRDCFYLEAVQSIEDSEEERNAQARVHVVYDTINALDVRNFFVSVDLEEYPRTSPSGRRIREQLDRWLARLDPDEVAAQVKREGYDSLPTLEYIESDWTIRFKAIPRAQDTRESPGGAVIGAIGGRARWLNTWESIRNSLLRKGRRYGQLDYPLIIAVNVVAFHLDRIEAMQALFGQEQYTFKIGESNETPNMSRAPNGFWNGPKGTRYTRVPAVALGYDLHPWTFAVQDLTLYWNPYVERPLSGEIARLTAARAEGDRMNWIRGVHLADILELPSEYPGRNTA